MASRSARAASAAHFTIEQLRTDRARVVMAAKGQEGAVVVDTQGERRFSIWIPQGPLAADE